MAAAVTRAFAAMAQKRALTDTYRTWFLAAGPQSLNLPMSAQLSEVFRGLGEED
jgi:hypothetical protein